METDTPRSATLEVSVIVPALNEAANLGPLVERIAAALQGVSYEVIVVDDNSQDGTPAVAQDLATRFPLRLLVRTQPRNGLSGAVLHGIAAARGTYLVVMDADLQHPPQRLPDLLAPLKTGESDFVVGSRYVQGGSTGVNWSLFRQLNSGVATLLARPFAGRCTDPMSGFFALRRDSYLAARRLTPLGYKIGLELMCKTRVQRLREIPINFGQRLHGQSKLSLKEQFRYLEHLSRLYDFTFPRASPVLKFLIVTLASWLTGLLVYAALLRGGDSSGVALAMGYLAALIVTALFHVRYIRTQREFLIQPRPWRDFALLALTEWIACCATGIWARARLMNPTPLEVFVLAFGAATIVRYIIRKETMQDIRGLRRELRPADVGEDATSHRS